MAQTDRVLEDAVNSIINEKPGAANGSASVERVARAELKKDGVELLFLVRAYGGDDIPVGHAVDENGFALRRYHIYLSRSALSLLALARKLKPEDLGVDGLLFIEVNAGDELSSGFIHTKKPEIETGWAMTRDIYHNYLFSVIGRLLGEEKHATLSAFTGGKRPAAVEGDTVTDHIIEMLEDLGKVISETSTDLGDKLHASRSLWHPNERSDDLKAVLGETVGYLRGAAGLLIDAMDTLIKGTTLPLDVLLGVLETALSEGTEIFTDILSSISDAAGDFADKVQAVATMLVNALSMIRRKLAELRGLSTTIADWFKSQAKDLNDNLDVLIGYLAGVWDGVVDAVLGFLDTINLVVTAVLGLFKLADNAGDVLDLSLEILDDLLATLDQIGWDGMWEEFMTNIYPSIRDTLTKQGRDLSQAIGDKITANDAAVGYYFGYLVYMVAEMFFPPMKLSKVAKGVDDGAKLTKAFFKRLGKFNKGTLPDIIDA